MNNILFFVTIGMSIDPAILIEHALAIVAGLAVLMAVKGAIVFGLGLSFGRGKAVAADRRGDLSQDRRAQEVLFRR